MQSAQTLIAIDPTLKAAAEKAARDNARSLPSFIEKLLSDYLTTNGYLRTRGAHGIPISQLNAESALSAMAFSATSSSSCARPILLPAPKV